MEGKPHEAGGDIPGSGRASGDSIGTLEDGKAGSRDSCAVLELNVQLFGQAPGPHHGSGSCALDALFLIQRRRSD